MNKLGVHALVWEKGWSHDECARAIARTAEVGFDLIEIPALEPGSIDTAFTRRQLEQAGIGATSSMGRLPHPALSGEVLAGLDTRLDTPPFSEAVR